MIAYREALALCDRATIDDVLALGRHHHADGRKREPYWIDLDELAECLALVLAGEVTR